MNVFETSLADAALRDRALNPAESFHLEAPAGSGKTSLLTARFLCLLGIVDHPRRILALTFTNKAAGEMRERVGRCLRKAKVGAAPDDELESRLLEFARSALRRHKNHSDLLLSGELLQIQTFHSFCYSVVTQAPLEAGIAPGSTLLPDPDQLYFLREVIDQTLLGVLERDPSDATRRALENRLLYLNNSWTLLIGELEELTRRRDALAELTHALNRRSAGEYIMEGTRAFAEVELSSLRDAFLKSVSADEWNDFMADLRAGGATLAHELPQELPGGEWEDLSAWRTIADALLTKAGAPRRQFGPANGFYSGFAKTKHSGMIQAIDPSVAERLHNARGLPLPEEATPDLDTLWDLILLLHTLIEACEERFRRQRRLDFTALETAALKLFDAALPSDLQLLLDNRIQHILIDEFQDTSRQQWSLLKLLCAGWSPGDGRTLFMVGDPKQSIYGFRKAEVALFMEARNGLPLDEFRKLPLESLQLSANFRSLPRLIDWCNDVFGGTVMKNPKPETDEVPFIPAVPARASKTSHTAFVPELSLFLDWPDSVSARFREADFLAHRLQRDSKDSGPDERIGVLLFARTHLPVYLEAFRRRGIPVQVEEGLKLCERPEAQFLWQLCRALVFPHDHLAWASQLRSPWLCLSFSDILAVSREEPTAWVEKVRAFAEKDERTRAFWESLRDARLQIGRKALSDALETAWLDVGGARVTADRWGSRGLACCRRFFDLVRQAEVGEPIQTIMRLELLLEQAYEPVDPETATSGISLMTVHRAKGLEFDAVYLPFMDWSPSAGQRAYQPPYLLERPPGAGGKHLLAARPDRLRGAPDPLYKLLSRLQAERRWGEAKRLFYVAATRARGRLVMSGVASLRSGDRSLVYGSRTPLVWLNEHYDLSGRVELRDFAAPGETAVEPPLEWRREWESDEGDFRVYIEPPAPAPERSPVEVRQEAVEPRPAPFERERPPFKVVDRSFSPESGSEAVEVADPDGAVAEPAASRALIRDRLVRRLLARFGRDRRPPSMEAVVGLLKSEGIEGNVAPDMAQASLAEVESCLEDPWLKRLYESPDDAILVETTVESFRSETVIHSWTVDLAVLVEGKRRLVVFLTGTPPSGVDEEDFLLAELRDVRPRVLDCRDAWAKMEGLERLDVESFVYWTALRRWAKCD